MGDQREEAPFVRLVHLLEVLLTADGPQSIADLNCALQERFGLVDSTANQIRRALKRLETFVYQLARTTKRSPAGGTCLAIALDPLPRGRRPADPGMRLLDLIALAIARDLLTPLAGTLFWPGIEARLAEVDAVVTPELLEEASLHLQGMVVHPQPPSPAQQPTLAAINNAIRHRVELQLTVHLPGQPRARRLNVQPAAVVAHGGRSFLAAFVPEEAAPQPPPQFFAIDQITRAKPTTRPFGNPAITLSESLAGRTTLSCSGESPRRYRLRIAAERVHWALNKPFHPEQALEPQADGSLILTIATAWDDEMLPAILSLGAHVEVLEPDDARDWLLDTVRAMIGRYACQYVQEFEKIYATRSTVDLD